MEKDRNDIYTAIFDVVRQVPKGRITTYGHIAAAIGMKSGARMVGYAMNHCNGIKPKVPAHRVLNSTGLLTGKAHFGPGDEMADLLRKEGIEVKDKKVQHFSQLLWDPAIELGF
jgi:methylated-DNA-protein-cysteine methyltransferase-like protein